jgi:phosphoribosylaminoimidazole-succinocarboxamide synthase
MDLLTCDLPGIRNSAAARCARFSILGNLLLVATDRISAFDCILPNAIPRKGEVLNQISAFWFEN